LTGQGIAGSQQLGQDAQLLFLACPPDQLTGKLPLAVKGPVAS
jgi:hypothetical protein